MEQSIFNKLRHGCGAHYHRIQTGKEIDGNQKNVVNVCELEEEFYQKLMLLKGGETILQELKWNRSQKGDSSWW